MHTDLRWEIIDRVTTRARELGREKERACPVDFVFWPRIGVFGLKETFEVASDDAIEAMAQYGLCKGWHSHQ